MRRSLAFPAGLRPGGEGVVAAMAMAMTMTMIVAVSVLGSGCATSRGSSAGSRVELPSGGRESLATIGTATVSDFDLEDAMAAAIEALADEVHDSAPSPVLPVLTVTGTVTYDIPMVDDERIDQWIDYLTGRGRHWYERWLSRSTRYVPLFWSILEEYGLPKDLVFLSMIESGFSPRAYSFARAAGPWQFMEATARGYGLKVGFWVDERRDFVKSTRAAAQYLRVLYKQFGDWHLAMAAYNAGETRVGRAMRASGRKDFWTLSRTSRLRRETRQYVPKLLAAARVGKKSDQYGFTGLDYLAPLEWDVLTVTVATDLKTIAGACQSGDVDHLKELNPELRWDITPPEDAYALRVPKGSADACAEGLKSLSPDARTTYRYRRLERGETLATLSAALGVSTEELLALNRYSPEDLETIEDLIVPVSLRAAASMPIDEPTAARPRERYRPPGARRVAHVVAPGDSLWKIGRRYRVSVRMLRLWNGLWNRAPLRAGQKLWVYPGSSGPAVARGVARTPSRPIAAVAKRPPDASSRSATVPSRSSSRAVSRGVGDVRVAGARDRHRVKSGESLWTIAQRYRTTVDRLVRANDLREHRPLKPGQVLRIE